MRALIVDDEEGIREGLAAFLRLHGITVSTAGSVADGLTSLAGDAFDAVVSDWRLEDGVALPLIERAACPCVVVSGYPEDVLPGASVVAVLPKPASPTEILRQVERLRPKAPAPDPRRLPYDARHRLRLVSTLLDGPAEVNDDGALLTVRGVLRDAEAATTVLEAIGGDWRFLQQGTRTTLELRLYRDGRPDGVVVVRRGEPWPELPTAFAIDLGDDPELPPGELLALLGELRRAAAAGHEVALLNLAPHLRFLIESLGRESDLPKRALAGPRLPPVLAELWR